MIKTDTLTVNLKTIEEVGDPIKEAAQSVRPRGMPALTIEAMRLRVPPHTTHFRYTVSKTLDGNIWVELGWPRQ